MTTITVLAGERTIGGTQIVVEEEGARLLFDCGLVYDPAGNPFAQVYRRSWRALADILALGLAPYVPGLYAPDALAEIPTSTPYALPPAQGPLAVALSHSHLDHTHLAGFVSPDVPIHCSAPTARIVRALGDLGESVGPLRRAVTIHEPHEPFMVGPMRARFVPVDHDVCGACGLLIETDEGVIAYSGDLRLHGSHPERTRAFTDAARDAGARLLVLEGTQLWPDDPRLPSRDENEVVTACAAALSQAPGRLGLILLTPENGERVEALAAALDAIGRVLVLDAAGLAFAHAALGRPIGAPHAVYIPSGPARKREQGEMLPETLRQAIDLAPRCVTAADLAREPGRFLLRLEWRHFADLLEVLPIPGGILLQANGTPLGSFDPASKQLGWWAHQLGLELLDVGSSGHAYPCDLTAIANTLMAPVVMGIHSEHPELLAVNSRLLLPERGRPYRLGALGR